MRNDIRAICDSVRFAERKIDRVFIRHVRYRIFFSVSNKKITLTIYAVIINNLND